MVVMTIIIVAIISILVSNERVGEKKMRPEDEREVTHKNRNE